MNGNLNFASVFAICKNHGFLPINRVLQGKRHQFILRKIETEGDVAISVRVKYVQQVVDEWLCVYVRKGLEPYHDPTKNTWQFDFFEMLPRDLSRAGQKTRLWGETFNEKETFLMFSEREKHEGEQYPDNYVFLIENHLLEDSGTYWIGIRPCRKNFDWDYFDTESISNKVFASDFEFNVWTQSCMGMPEKDASNPDQQLDYSTRGIVVRKSLQR